MKLDIGCGNVPFGDVNVDLPRSNPHRDGKELAIGKIRNLVFASAYDLPFRDDVFNEVVSCHMLEHLEMPLAALKEMVRVSKNFVTVVIPAFGYRGECGMHLYTWSEGSLNNILRKAGLNNVKVSSGLFREVKGNILKWIYSKSYVLGNFFMILTKKLWQIELQGKGKKPCVSV